MDSRRDVAMLPKVEATIRAQRARPTGVLGVLDRSCSTFVTLMLASGEAPAWIATQRGHTTTLVAPRINRGAS